MDFLKVFFLPSTIIEWNNFYLRNAPAISVFKQNILKFILLNYPAKVYNVRNPTGLNLLTKFRLGLRHLCAHNFSYNFSHCFDKLCICRTNIESKKHFLFQCLTESKP